jgi:DNA-binding transcriptional regulator LsrR (DeoR family)
LRRPPALCYNYTVALKRARTIVQDRRTEDLLAEIARAYYERELTQEQVAAQFGVSRSQVSRYLRDARAQEIVQIRIVAPESRHGSIESALRERFPHLLEVIVPAAFSTSTVTIRRAIARAGARLVDRLVRPGSTVCFGAGTTLAELVEMLRRHPRRNVTVVQAMGNAGHEGLRIDYNAIAQRAAAAFDGRAIQINAPAILGPGARAVDLAASNRNIGDAVRVARSADLYVLGVGSLTGDEIYVETGLISLEELDLLRRDGAVGDICGNFYDIAGRQVSSPFRDRLVGIRIEDLRRAQRVVALAGGAEKVPAIFGALNGRLVNALVTDEHTARGVLELGRERDRRKTAAPNGAATEASAGGGS